jgi:hypothetical protein
MSDTTNGMEECIDTINRRSDAEWQWWLYRLHSERLVLHDFRKKLFIVFRRPTYVRLAPWLGAARFEIVRDRADAPIPESLLVPGAVTIRMVASGVSFYVVCDSVGFFEGGASGDV